MLSVIADASVRAELHADLDELAREGARRMLAAALEAEVLESAQQRWRAVNGPHLVALVRAGARFDKGVIIQRPDEVQEVAA